MAYLPRENATVGSAFEIDVRGKVRAAVVAERPLYRRTDPAPR
jgi:glycine cleavage system aminomethyltransferase T